MNPARSWERITCLPSWSSAKCCATSTVSFTVRSELTSSTSGQHRHGIEEVDSDHLRWSLGGHGQTS